MWTREGVVNPPPEAILIVGPTDTPAASLERNVDEFEFTGEAQKDGKFKQVSEVLRETSIGDEGVDALKVQVDKATSLLRFVTGDGRSRGLIQELLVQRETFAQTTGRMKPSIEAKYKDTADEIEKFAKALNTYYVGDDAQVQSLITELAEAQIIYERRTRPSGYEWVKKGGGPRDTGSTVDVPFKKKPFAFEFGEAIPVDAIDPKNPSALATALIGIKNRCIGTMDMQRAVAQVAKEKVETVRDSIFTLFNEGILKGGLLVEVESGTPFGRQPIQRILQHSDLFNPKKWQNASITDIYGTETTVLGTATGKPDKDTIFGTLKFDAIKNAPVENLLDRLIAAAVEPLASSIVGMFGILDNIDKGLTKMHKLMTGDDGFVEVIREYDIIRPNMLNNDKLTLSPSATKLSMTSNLSKEELKFQEGAEVSERSAAIKNKLDDLETVYLAVQTDAISAYKVLGVCVTEGPGKVSKWTGTGAKTAGFTRDQLFADIAKTMFEAMTTGDAKYTSISYQDADGKVHPEPYVVDKETGEKVKGTQRFVKLWRNGFHESEEGRMIKLKAGDPGISGVPGPNQHGIITANAAPRVLKAKMTVEELYEEIDYVVERLAKERRQALRKMSALADLGRENKTRIDELGVQQRRSR
jgi:hypothetical protein